jgi:hypothetical protein
MWNCSEALVKISNMIKWWLTSGTTCTSGNRYAPTWRDGPTGKAALICDLRGQLEPAMFTGE